MGEARKSECYTEQYRKLPHEIKKGIVLLRAGRALRQIEPSNCTVGQHFSYLCPVSTIYSVKHATAEWKALTSTDKATLIRFGWNKTTYEAFIDWYDRTPQRTSKERVLQWCLEQKRLPRIAA